MKPAPRKFFFKNYGTLASEGPTPKRKMPPKRKNFAMPLFVPLLCAPKGNNFRNSLRLIEVSIYQK